MSLKLNLVVESYIEALFWAEDIEVVVVDLPVRLKVQCIADCKYFLELITNDPAIDCDRLDSVQVGHDFFLTRNGHGAGFWDRGLVEVGERLTVIAESFGHFEYMEYF